ncbi:response regulator [Ferruginibacter lapsinanis]|uniref:response regulator n=1 Tax=Ferruginibacter lapsinanis TaxID=563172 RepID=UPI001E44CA9C|nr:response regulator [Ferruginibacter lapsinanis]UEG51041.1 response regulator [Ferruginibacter lapsinanis]
MVKALIIDDEIDICYLLSSILRTKNLQVSYVNSISEATISLEKQQPEIIFLDNHLPDGLGIDFIKQLKLSYPSTKVVMITAFDNYSDRTKAFNNGVDTFISKPFTKNLIYQTVDNLTKA